MEYCLPLSYAETLCLTCELNTTIVLEKLYGVPQGPQCGHADRSLGGRYSSFLHTFVAASRFKSPPGAYARASKRCSVRGNKVYKFVLVML